MGKIETSWREGLTRRHALAGMAGFLAGSSLLRAQQDPYSLDGHRRALGLDEMQDVWDFEEVFNANLPLAVSDYTAHGDGTEWTVRRNRQAFDWVDLVPAPAVNPATVDLSTEVFGLQMKYPIMIAPTANHRPLHPDGEAATHVGSTAAARTPYIVAHLPSVGLPRVAAAADGPMWYQLYGLREPEANRAILEQAQALGCMAVVVTVDQQASYYPRTLQDRHLIAGMQPPVRPGDAALRQAAAARASGPARYGIDPQRLWYSWDWLDEIRKFIKVPVLAKGILTAEDAQLCVDRGVGIIVSNHGGRSLNYDPSTLEALPEIVAAVRGRVPVLFDSGIRRGRDILKALALGANAVCLGRVPRWGLGAFGAEGVQRVLEILQAELVQAAAETGHTHLNTVNRDALRVRFS